MDREEEEIVTPKRISRRTVLRVMGACGVVAAGSSCGAWLWFGSDSTTGESASGVFRKDAPDAATWDLWQKRGWTHEAMHYSKLGRNVRCNVCPNHCLLEPGDRSHCRNKVNRDGTLFTMAYANPASFHVDPVEKKPLFHFHPGSRTFSIATSGCVLRCLNCQNWELSQSKPEQLKDPKGEPLRLKGIPNESFSMSDIARLTMLPEDVVEVAIATNCPSISYTYSEPVAFYEYTYDTADRARKRNLKNILVTSGYIEEQPLRELARNFDAAHVDLKGFDEKTYEKLNSGKLQTVLDTIKTLKGMGVWVEVINLVVPTHTDNLDTIRRMSEWLAKNAGEQTPLHFSRFHAAHKLTNLPPTPVDTLVKARDLARGAGLKHVYVGNVRGVPDAETTFCPGCRKPVVQRDMFAIIGSNLRDGKCTFCNAPVAGVWS